MTSSFDVHIYFFQDNSDSVQSATALRSLIKETFPGLEVYSLHTKPVGPHPIGMFEVDLRTPEQFAQFVPWLVTRHGQHNVLIHPLTGDDVRDHTENACWLGDKMPLILDNLGK